MGEDSGVKWWRGVAGKAGHDVHAMHEMGTVHPHLCLSITCKSRQLCMNERHGVHQHVLSPTHDILMTSHIYMCIHKHIYL